MNKIFSIVLLLALTNVQSDLYGQSKLAAYQFWTKYPTFCNSKDGVITYRISGGVKPYHVDRNGFNAKSPVNMIATNFAADFDTRDTFYIVDSAQNPSKLKFALENYGIWHDASFECVQQMGKENEYFYILDSVSMIHYPFRVSLRKLIPGSGWLDVDTFLIQKPDKKSINIKVKLRKNMLGNPDKNYISISDYAGCTTGTVGIDFNNNFEDPKIYLVPDTVKAVKNIIPDEKIELRINLNANFYKASWFKNDIATQVASATSYQIMESTNTTYTVRTVDAFGCKLEAKSYLIYYDSLVNNRTPDINDFIPTIFSPNDDGINDYFIPFVDNNVEKISQFQIFDRWGNQLFEAAGLDPNDEINGWNGKQKGADVLQGCYSYWIKYKLKNGKELSKKGEVQLVR
ncbi:MAG: gliding motility-associated C-terminal domain-containing protein [Saprospiraceae bacterium]